MQQVVILRCGSMKNLGVNYEVDNLGNGMMIKVTLRIKNNENITSTRK